jgi:hypothetical protein
MRETTSTIFSTTLLLVALVLGGNACQAEELPKDELPKVDVTIYYSKDDPDWPAAEKQIDAVGKDQTELNIIKVSIDDPAGYKQLAQAEQDLQIKKTGDITLVMGPISLTSKGERRDVERYFGPMARRFLHPDNLKGRVPADVKGYAAEIFGGNAVAEAQALTDNENVEYHQIRKDGKIIGWIVLGYSHIVCPVCNDAQFLIAVSSPELKILGVKPVRELERWGAKLDDKETAGYVGQYIGRTPADADKKADIISRATKTSTAYENTIKAILLELKKREQK